MKGKSEWIARFAWGLMQTQYAWKSFQPIAIVMNSGVYVCWANVTEYPHYQSAMMETYPPNCTFDRLRGLC